MTFPLVISCCLFSQGCSGESTGPDPDDGGATGTFQDERDGVSYRWVSLGTQVWMAENLDYSTPAGSWCYHDLQARCVEYGRLYNWEAAMNACPAGWHLPTESEWDALVNAVGPEPGAKLKTGGDSGFNAQLGGFRTYDQWFVSVGVEGHYWTSTYEGVDHARERIFWQERTDVASTGFGIIAGVSVRCVRD